MGGKRLGCHETEEDARTKVFNHLVGNPNHGFTEDVARKLASEAGLETWGPDQADHVKRVNSDGQSAHERPVKRRALTNEGSGSASFGSGTQSSGSQLATLAERAGNA